MNIEALVNRFLTWPVPASVYPDGVPGQPGRTGTNLLSAIEARQMLEYVLADVLREGSNPKGECPPGPSAEHEEPGREAARAQNRVRRISHDI